MRSRYNHLPSYKYTDIEGVSPILEKSAGKALRNYKIYGNSVQSGIPSVEQPQEIKCVGDKTKNLWSYGDLNTSTTKNAVFDFNLTGSYVFSFALNYESCELPNSALFQLTVDGVAKYLAPVNVVTNGASRASIRISGHITKIQLINWSELVGDIIDIQLEEGTSMTKYEPYGYKIPISVRGKNIFNYKDFIQAIKNSDMIVKDKANADNVYLGEECFSYANWGRNSDNTTTEDIIIEGFKENTQYTFSGEYSFKFENYTDYSIGMLNIIYTDGSYSSLSANRAYIDKYTKVTLTTTAGKTIRCVRIPNFSSTAIIYVKKNFQIEEGTVAIPYEPYVEPKKYNIFLDEPIRKLQSATDYIDYINQTIVRNVSVMDNTGTLPIEESYNLMYNPVEKPIELPTLETSKYTNVIEVNTTLQPSNVKIQYYKKG